MAERSPHGCTQSHEHQSHVDCFACPAATFSFTTDLPPFSQTQLPNPFAGPCDAVGTMNRQMAMVNVSSDHRDTAWRDVAVVPRPAERCVVTMGDAELLVVAASGCSGRLPSKSAATSVAAPVHGVQVATPSSAASQRGRRARDPVVSSAVLEGGDGDISCSQSTPQDARVWRLPLGRCTSALLGPQVAVRVGDEQHVGTDRQGRSTNGVTGTTVSLTLRYPRDPANPASNLLRPCCMRANVPVAVTISQVPRRALSSLGECSSSNTNEEGPGNTTGLRGSDAPVIMVAPGPELNQLVSVAAHAFTVDPVSLQPSWSTWDGAHDAGGGQSGVASRRVTQPKAFENPWTVEAEGECPWHHQADRRGGRTTVQTGRAEWRPTPSLAPEKADCGAVGARDAATALGADRGDLTLHFTITTSFACREEVDTAIPHRGVATSAVGPAGPSAIFVVGVRIMVGLREWLLSAMVMADAIAGGAGRQQPTRRSATKRSAEAAGDDRLPMWWFSPAAEVRARFAQEVETKGDSRGVVGGDDTDNLVSAYPKAIDAVAALLTNTSLVQRRPLTRHVAVLQWRLSVATPERCPS